MNRPPRLLGSILLAVCDLKDTGGSSIKQIRNYLKTRSKKDNLPSSATAISAEIQKALSYGTKNHLLAAHGEKFRMSSKFLSSVIDKAEEKQKANDDVEGNMPTQEGKRGRRRSSKSRKTRRGRRKSRRTRSSSLQNEEDDDNNSKLMVAKRRRRRKPTKRLQRKRRSRTRSRSVHKGLEDTEQDQNVMEEPIASEDATEEATIEELVYPDDLPHTVENSE